MHTSVKIILLCWDKVYWNSTLAVFKRMCAGINLDNRHQNILRMITSLDNCFCWTQYCFWLAKRTNLLSKQSSLFASNEDWKKLFDRELCQSRDSHSLNGDPTLNTFSNQITTCQISFESLHFWRQLNLYSSKKVNIWVLVFHFFI